MRQPIPCDLHDYLEIACIYGVAVRLNLKDADDAPHETPKSLVGHCITTLTDPRKLEWLLLQTDTVNHCLPLDQLMTMISLDLHAPFQQVQFC